MHLKWVNVTIGILLILAPFVFGYSQTPAALWSSLGMGAMISVLGYLDLPRWLAVAGGVTFMAPFIFHFSAIEPAMWVCITIGAVIAVINVYEAYLVDEAKATKKQQHTLLSNPNVSKVRDE